MPAFSPPPVSQVPPPVPGVAPVAAAGGLFAVVEAFVFTIYRTGFVQSLILHLATLLVLALIVIRPDPPPQTAIAIDFAEADSGPEPEVTAIDRPLPVPQEFAEPEDAAPLPLVDLPEAEVDIELDPVEPATFTMEAEVTELDAAALLADVASPTGAGAAPAAASRGGGGAGGDGAIGGEIGRRLAAAGAGTGDVQVSIAWDNVNDIDLHVLVEPVERRFGSSLINFTNRVGIAGGCLDVDRNVHPTTVTPVENVYWGRGMAPFGRFTVGVHHYRAWAGDRPTVVEIVVLVDGMEQRFRAVLHPGDPLAVVTSFERLRGGTRFQREPSAAAP